MSNNHHNAGSIGSFCRRGVAAAAGALLVLLGAAGCGGTETVSKSNTEVVRELLEVGLGQADAATVKRLVAENMIQHNPTAKDGRAGVLEFVGYLAKAPAGSFKVRIARVLADGELVLTHSDYVMKGKPTAGFDLFRVRDGLIVEHWDALQEQPSQTVSGRTMLDGPTQVSDLDRTEANRALVRRLIETVMIKGDMSALPGFFDGDTYLQHNPMVGDGLSGLQKGMAEMAKKGMTMHITRLHKVVAQGNFVLTQSEGTMGDKATAFYDLFRVQNGEIAEHWDVIQTIPATMPHKNGMF